MIRAFVTMLCGVVSLACILRQQRIIQIQSEQIQKYREILALRDEQLGIYENVNRKQANQIQLLKDGLERSAAIHEHK